ncbi:MAG: DUF362 domain-containing protein [Planctomycetia bacterium]|nr:DUF362 domain-containing protein [Planctomycetia bacterium]
MTRKDFLKTVAFAGLTTTFTSLDPVATIAQAGELGGKQVDFVALLGGEPDVMFKRGIEALGGITRFVKKGDRVTIKPNIGWDKTPELAGNTNPLLISTLIYACKDAGAKEIVVFDNTCDFWQACYKNSGIEEAAKKAGAVVVPANEERYYREVRLPNAKVLKSAKIHEALLDCDCWFNVPVLKNHGGARMTICMKNLMGIVWDRRAFHQKGLDQCIADIGTLEKPAALNIVDAYRIMKTNGPRGRDDKDVSQPKGLFMSTDPVAVDTAAVKFFNQFQPMPVENVKYLPLGEELGLGVTDASKLTQARIKI